MINDENDDKQETNARTEDILQDETTNEHTTMEKPTAKREDATFSKALELVKHIEKFNGEQDPKEFIEAIELTGLTMEIRTILYTKLACTMLRGEAARWLLDRIELRNTSWENFKNELMLRFQTNSNESALIKIMELKKGTRDIIEYVRETRNLRRQIELKIPENDLISIFIRGLNLREQEMMSLTRCTSLEEAMNRAITINRIHQRMEIKTFRNPEKMEPRNLKIDRDEYICKSKTGPQNPHSREKCEREGLCFVCGQQGHLTPQRPMRNDMIRTNRKMYRLVEATETPSMSSEDFHPDSIPIADEGMESTREEF